MSFEKALRESQGVKITLDLTVEEYIEFDRLVWAGCLNHPDHGKKKPDCLVTLIAKLNRVMNKGVAI